MDFTQLNAHKQLRRLRNQLVRPRGLLLVASAAAIAVIASTSLTQAAWTDNEWANTSVGTATVGDCTTNNLFQNRAWGRQLTGMIAGVNLDTLAGVDGVTVSNNGNLGSVVPASATEVTPPGNKTTYISQLPVGVLGAQNPLVTAALGLGVPIGGLGAYAQWGQAKANGLAHGAAGLVSDQSGAVDVTGTKNGANSAPVSATVDLSNLLPAALAGVSLKVGAVAAEASMNSCEMVSGWPQLTQNPVPIRKYGIAGLDLNANVPAVKAVAAAGVKLTNTVQTTLTGLISAGQLSTAITEGVVALLSAVLNPLGLGAKTTGIKFSEPNLSELTALMSQPMTDGVLTVDLGAGTVKVDIATLMNGPNGLNNLGPNHELILDDATINALVAKLGEMLDAWVGRVLAAVKKTLWDVTITSTTDISLLLGLGTIKATVGPISIGQLIATPTPTTPQPILEIKLLGSSSGLLTPVTNLLVGGANGVVATALKATSLADGILTPTPGTDVAKLTAPVVTAAEALLKPFSQLVSVRINVQPDQPWGGSTSRPTDVTALPAGSGTSAEYKVSAIRVGLINQANVLGLSLANASVGPAGFHP